MSELGDWQELIISVVESEVFTIDDVELEYKRKLNKAGVFYQEPLHIKGSKNRYTSFSATENF